MKKLLLLCLTMLIQQLSLLRAQILVPEDAQAPEGAIVLQSSEGRLWMVSKIGESGGISTFSVSAKSGGTWKRYGSFKALTQQNSKFILFHDIEVFNNKVYLVGDFAVPGSSNNCLIAYDLNNNQNGTWKSEFSFSAAGLSPVITSLAICQNTLYLGGIFGKAGNLECNNMARINSNFLLQQFKVSKNVGANGGIRAMDADSTSTLLYIAGNFRTFTGQSANGFVRFRVKDSALLTPIVSSDVAVIKMRNIGSSLLLFTEDTANKERKIWFLQNGSLEKIGGLDSLFEVSNFFRVKWQCYFSGVAKPELDVRGLGIFSIAPGAKASRIFRKLNGIQRAESFNNDIYVTGVFSGILSSIKYNFTVARIDENYQRVYGRVYYDRDGSGTFTNGDTKPGDRNAQILPYNALIPVDELGFFTFIVPKNKSQLVKINFVKTPEISKAVSFVFNTDTFNERLIQFPLTLVKSNYSDIRVKLTSAGGWNVRKDTSELYVLKVTNNGVSAATPDINLNFSGKIVLIKPFPAPDVINPGNIRWEKEPLQAGESKYYLIKLTTPSTSFNVNDKVDFSAEITGVVDDNPADNTDSLQQTVSEGIAPNTKLQYPAAAGNTAASLDPNAGKIEYIIRFTNTTNDTLNTVIVRDTVATPDYVTYIQETGASHTFSRDVYTSSSLPEKVIVVYTFNNINLPPNPSGNSELVNSSGYIGFKLGLSPSLSIGTEITNQASITLDNQIAIVTNMVKARVYSSSISAYEGQQSFTIYPNPFHDILNFSESANGAIFALYDPTGRMIVREKISSQMLDLQDFNLATGSYIYRIQTANGSSSAGTLIKNN